MQQQTNQLRTWTMDDVDAIHHAFVTGQLDYLDAIERLQRFGLSPLRAEYLVRKWVDQGREVTSDGRREPDNHG